MQTLAQGWCPIGMSGFIFFTVMMIAQHRGLLVVAVKPKMVKWQSLSNEWWSVQPCFDMMNFSPLIFPSDFWLMLSPTTSMKKTCSGWVICITCCIHMPLPHLTFAVPLCKKIPAQVTQLQPYVSKFCCTFAQSLPMYTKHLVYCQISQQI